MFIALASTKNIFFIAVAHALSLLWQLIMGNVKIGLYSYVAADIFTNVLQKCSLSSTLPNISFIPPVYEEYMGIYFLSFQ